MDKKNIYAVVMAGGVGERFWPVSRTEHPKQFSALFTGEPMLLTTVKRLKGFVADENLIIVTNSAYTAATRKVLKGRRGVRVIGEPVGKNTAPAIAAAAAAVYRKNSKGLLLVFPADHIIKPLPAFIKTLKKGLALAEEGKLVLFGVVPNRPHTGLGYIELGQPAGARVIGAFHVRRFVEKPGLAAATAFVESRQYLWNCGIFAFGAGAILAAFKKHMPDLYALLASALKASSEKQFEKAIETFYHKVRKESIDYGVWEKSREIAVVKTHIYWNDVGSWDAFYDLLQKDSNKNVFKGPCVDLGSRNTMAVCDSGLVATCGLSNMVVVKQDDMVLVISGDRLGDIKQLVACIREKK
ncbi:MAG: hypothetical protein A2268_05620 [Candidatus Raymondbacteria bacterium RifOxyA12_full_50_37]|uniref:mannose-1-phosphate guanylyltransferase n=1 Tax=Candidatus Raymondbacteria bacterium RIFOXYD12_FULL_49_13 TaxID=1817890 RepID=A0A1F7F561_UNCRA|nr:MAG: hypothetical protein A2268_05620 [Candidatus Raymondbacteria bacterium RifOxyA12_full_50_37]OGJ89042.1 MAG: hypothetical protein A2248_02855 [Candidatus Raymondbacteria bacterium RIFOXYA2_FULL_49_16]OGJ95360.1 MAG: hypothetical protein A2350_14690 [Candidatus Raymondbacteria bacterium RifOxyB12_full_50_8]OGJ97069.1 MAG: hypothetical protein A2453_04270 [Candidatus Raymondbacteria bacterium RIFOXYC2_FULL_50_21]OGK01779.1 MAG: hypothetical protein A2519_01715 [Candidatus Raymondbacteria b